MALRTDYKDDILDLTQNTKRKYRMVTNADGTVSFEDMTVYSQVGDSFGAAELNEIANVVNEGGSNMYYDPETDIKYLRNQDGEWINVGYGGLLDKYLYSGSANEAEFVGFKGSISGVANTSTADSVPDVTVGSALTITSTGLSGCAISKAIDFTEYTKLKFHHNSWASNNDYSNIHIAITSDKQQVMTPILVQKLVDKNTSLEADEEIDVSAINGSYYIVIHLNHNQSGGTPTTTSISDMYLVK